MPCLCLAIVFSQIVILVNDIHYYNILYAITFWSFGVDVWPFSHFYHRYQSTHCLSCAANRSAHAHRKEAKRKRIHGRRSVLCWLSAYVSRRFLTMTQIRINGLSMNSRTSFVLLCLLLWNWPVHFWETVISCVIGLRARTRVCVCIYIFHLSFLFARSSIFMHYAWVRSVYISFIRITDDERTYENIK